MTKNLNKAIGKYTKLRHEVSPVKGWKNTLIATIMGVGIVVLLSILCWLFLYDLDKRLQWERRLDTMGKGAYWYEYLGDVGDEEEEEKDKGRTVEGP